MQQTEAIRLTYEALWLVLQLSGPPIIVASIVGLVVALVQAATQLQEQTLQYTLKFIRSCLKARCPCYDEQADAALTMKSD